MVPTGSKVQQFLLCTLIPVICSIVLGFICYQEGVFYRTHGSFQFVWNAIVASAFYHLLVFLRPRDAYLGLIVLFGLTLVTTESTRPAYILRDIFYVAAIATTMLIYIRYFEQRTRDKVGFSAVTLAGTYGVVYIIFAEVHFWILRTFGMESTGGSVVGVATATAFFGLLIGFAVGTGIPIARKLFRQSNNT